RARARGSPGVCARAGAGCVLATGSRLPDLDPRELGARGEVARSQPSLEMVAPRLRLTRADRDHGRTADRMARSDVPGSARGDGSSSAPGATEIPATDRTRNQPPNQPPSRGDASDAPAVRAARLG